ncbi:MAG: hypothetical protein BSOLF_0299 [Candidatus Carbobacillus altaicus]|uniref:HTH luxR-type domain-containing protein n=1 Tax=Candidatus Carbonibacillus altaicus TaxID=2163959 RepID=A0A2R6Y111_9BACL|nr:MAG: hypothetical protein BSOLF_0299 [Candidatus Carbobacillus altaicus]
MAHTQVEEIVSWIISFNEIKQINQDRNALIHFLAFILDQFLRSGNNLASLKQNFQSYLIENQHALNAQDALTVVHYFEKNVCTLIEQRLPMDEAQTVCKHIFHVVEVLHDTIIYIYYPSALDQRYVDLPPSSLVIEDTMHTPFLAMLNQVKWTGEWSWIGLIQLQPDIQILEMAIWNQDTGSFTLVGKHASWNKKIMDTLEKKDAFIFRIGVALTTELVAYGSGTKLDIHRLRQIGEWLRRAFRFTMYLEDTLSLKDQKLQLYDAVLQFDNALLQCDDVWDVFEVTVEKGAQLAGFKRSALFWYTMITKTFQGVHGYNVPIESIRSIHITLENLVKVREVLETSHPVFYEDMAQRLPKHYVDEFHLTSLIFIPLRLSNDPRPLAVLLIDQGGTPFTLDNETRVLLERLMQRATQAIHYHLKRIDHLTKTPAAGILNLREQQVLSYIAEGLSTNEIAQQLYISEHTVNEYVRNILKKLEATNRSHAVAKAMKLRLI